MARHKPGRVGFTRSACSFFLTNNHSGAITMATATQERKTELAKPQSPFSAPIKFDVSMEQIDQLKREYMPLAILDVNDKAQVEKVHVARMDVTRRISGIEKGSKPTRSAATTRPPLPRPSVSALPKQTALSRNGWQ